MDERPLHVLLIEDSATDAQLIREALLKDAALSFDLTHAQRLSDGLKRLSEGSWDVVLLDLRLPDSQGLETLIKVRERSGDASVVILTAFDDMALAVEALEQGAKDYLVKGYVWVYPNLLGRSIRYALERRRSEQALQRLASFAEQSPNPIIETDGAGVVTYVNPAALEQFPDLAERGLDHPVLRAMHNALAALERNEPPSLLQEVTDGNRVYEQHIWVPEPHVVRAFAIEVTQRKQLERLKEEFLSTVSHELRTPLTTVKEFIAIIADELAGPLTAEQQRYLGTVRENIDRLARIVNDLLDMAKIEAGRLILDRAPVAPAALIDHVLQSMRFFAQTRAVALESQVEARVPQIFADADKVTQVLINLVSNAIKFTQPGGRVEVRVFEQSSEVEFSVADTGIGITPEDVPKLFDKFYQFSRAMPGGTSIRGTGLGLAISQRLVKLHGGHIRVTSEPGRGSVFAFTLPKHQPDEVFREYLKRGIEQAQRQQASFSIALVGLANFQELKALYGLEDTSRLLKAVEHVVVETVRRRAGDVVTRGQRGDMVVMLADVDRAGARAIAQRLHQAIEAHTLTLNAKAVAVSVVTATATYPEEALTDDELMQLLERRLQQLTSRKTRILVVDDEPKIRQFLQRTLELHEYEVSTAAGGLEALEQLKREPVDLILLDLMMPGIDGYEVHRLVKDDPRTWDIPVIIVTAKGDRTDHQRALPHAAYHYVAKPFNLEDLLARIRDVLMPQHVIHRQA